MTTTVSDLKNLQGNSFRARVQRFGGYLSSMIMPNIGAFIAWGLITAMFIPTGWLPNATLAALVGPMITFLLPVLIGYTGGRLVHGQRGAVVGAIATIGVAVGADMPMFLGAMTIGPLSAFLLRKFDTLVEGRIRPGFEMLVANFSAGILGAAMAVAGVAGVGPVMSWLAALAGKGVDVLVGSGLLPLVSLVVEPAKLLFLNNAVNHGVISPLGAAQAGSAGKSVLFMIETNPGPGLGILIAYLLFGPRTLRPSVPGAVVIHFLGGIHEIYFPYVLMKPRLVLAAIAGGAAGVGTAVLTGAGLVATPSPGSVFAYLAVTPRHGYAGVVAAIVIATAVSFAVAAPLLRFPRPEPDRREAVQPVAPEAEDAKADDRPTVSGLDVKTVIVACDAGMGSSVMLASQLRKRFAQYGVTVVHRPVNEIPPDCRLVLTHADLAARARAVAPGAVVIAFRAYLRDPVFEEIETAIREGSVLRG